MLESGYATRIASLREPAPASEVELDRLLEDGICELEHSGRRLRDAMPRRCAVSLRAPLGDMQVRGGELKEPRAKKLRRNPSNGDENHEPPVPNVPQMEKTSKTPNCATGTNARFCCGAEAMRQRLMHKTSAELEDVLASCARRRAKGDRDPQMLAWLEEAAATALAHAVLASPRNR